MKLRQSNATMSSDIRSLIQDFHDHSADWKEDMIYKTKNHSSTASMQNGLKQTEIDNVDF